MSTVATARPGAASNRMSIAALAGGLATLAAWALAESVSDAFYLVAMAVGIVTVVVGARARRGARRSGAKGRLALAATIIGGVPAALIVVYSVVYGISKLV